MDNDDRPGKPGDGNRQGFLTTLLQGMIRDTLGMWIVVLFGVSVGAVICHYYGVPLVFSLLGGVLVLAVYVAWDRL